MVAPLSRLKPYNIQIQKAGAESCLLGSDRLPASDLERYTVYHGVLLQ
jgi:hypothetical protein